MKSYDCQLQALKENFSLDTTGVSFKEWVELTAQSDPGFYSWFFGVELDQDFDTSLTNEHREEFQAFLNSLS